MHASTGKNDSSVSSRTKQIWITAWLCRFRLGITDPEFFHLLPLFQDKVGPDRLSDMIATIILPDIEAYTLRIISQLDIMKNKYPEMDFEDGFLRNPYMGYKVLLLPTEILHKLPVAKSWVDIDSVVTENRIIREIMNANVAEEWLKWATTDRKYYLREKIFNDSDKCKSVVAAYRDENLAPYNPEEQFDYFLERLWQRIEREGLVWESQSKETDVIDSKTAAKEILKQFKIWLSIIGAGKLYYNQAIRNVKRFYNVWFTCQVLHI